jgi:hypothetical protein
LSHINSRAYRSLHQFSLNKNSNSIETSLDQSNSSTVAGQPIKKFLTHQPIVTPLAPQDSFSQQSGNNGAMTYTSVAAGFQPGVSHNEKNTNSAPKTSNALDALHREFPDATGQELEQLLKSRLRASFTRP